MINISLSKLRNPMKPEEARKYYARVQFTDTFSLEQFAAHVAAHNSKYDEGDIYLVMRTAVQCLEELVKLGYKVSLGKLGAFYPSVSSTGAASRAEFTEDNIRSLSVNWDRPKQLDNIKEGVSFNKVLSRSLQAALMKNLADNDTEEMLDYVNAYPQGDAAVKPDEGEVPEGGESSGSGTSSGGSNNPDPNA